MIRVSVVGATGYVGEELIRILSGHPQVKITSAVSKTFAGQKLSGVYPSFLEEFDIVLEDLDVDEIAKKSDVAFLCLPHTQSFLVAPALLERGIKVIDLSGDFRYDDVNIYEKWYDVEHKAKDLLSHAVYGMPEYYRNEIKKTNLLANPGCYTTASILALAPLLKNNLIQKEDIVVDAKSGVTGAGRKESLSFSYCEVADNFKAYSIINHRHTSEIEEQLAKASGEEIQLLFTPHLLPVKRGILATIYTKLVPGTEANAVDQAYAMAYHDEPFTHIKKRGNLPELKQVVGSNHCIIGYEISKRTGRLILVSCIDNLIKGAAGQAIHNFNIMNGIEETTGLPQVAMYL